MGWKDGTPVNDAPAATSRWMTGKPIAGVPVKAQPPAGRGKGGLFEKADALVRGAADSLTFGFGDEIAAGVNTILPVDTGSVSGFRKGFGAAYDQNLALQRGRDDYDTKNNGGARLTGQVAGALVPAVGGARVAAAAPTAMRAIGRGAVAGAASGAVGGFGSGEGGFDNRAESALGGAAVGGALGAAGGAAMELAPHVANIYNQFTMRYPQAEAVAQTLRALQRDGLTLTQAQAAIDNFRSMGKPAVLADVGANLRARAGVAARSPGASQTLAREVLNRRLTGQGERLNADIRQTVSPRVDVRAADDELLQQARTRAAPLYDAAYGEYVPLSDNLQSLLDTPAGRAGLSRARTIAANERVNPNEVQLDIGPNGEWMPTSAPTLRTLDLVKRGLDDVLESGPRHPMTGRPMLDDNGRAVNGVRAQLLNEMDGASENYRAARAAYAGPAQARDALAEGRNFTQLDPEQIAAGQAGRDPTAADMFRVGAARKMTDTVNKGKPWTNRANGIASTPQQLLQLQAMGADANELARRAAAERDLMQLNDELRGSQTNMRGLAQADAEGPALPASLPTSTGGLIGRGVGWLNNQIRGRRMEAVNDAAGPLLFGDNPQDLGRALQAMARAESMGLLQRGARSRVVQGGGAGLGLLSSPTLAIRDRRQD